MKFIIRNSEEFEAVLAAIEKDETTDTAIELTAHDPQNAKFKVDPSNVDYEDEKYKLTPENIRALFALIQKKGITKLGLTDGLIRSGARSALATAVAANTTLQHLNLSNNDLESTEAAERKGDCLLCQAITAHKGIRTLILRNRESDSKILIEGLTRYKRITYLDLSLDPARLTAENHLLYGEEGAAFAKMASVCPLTHLVLARRSMDRSTAQAFGDVFQKNSTLKFMDLQNSFMGCMPTVLEMFLSGLSRSVTMEDLNLTGLNGADADAYVRLIIKFIKRGSPLRHLTLKQCDCDLVTVEVLYEAALEDKKLILEFEFMPPDEPNDEDRQKMGGSVAHELDRVMSQLKRERDQRVAQIIEIMESRKLAQKLDSDKRDSDKKERSDIPDQTSQKPAPKSSSSSKPLLFSDQQTPLSSPPRQKPLLGTKVGSRRKPSPSPITPSSSPTQDFQHLDSPFELYLSFSPLPASPTEENQRADPPTAQGGIPSVPATLRRKKHKSGQRSES